MCHGHRHARRRQDAPPSTGSSPWVPGAVSALLRPAPQPHPVFRRRRHPGPPRCDYVKNLPASANVQFVAFTDHSNYFDSTSSRQPRGRPVRRHPGQAPPMPASTWNTYKDHRRRLQRGQRRLHGGHLAGFEMTWSGGPGHINTFNTPGIVSRNNYHPEQQDRLCRHEAPTMPC